MQLSNLQLPGIVTTCRFITASQLQTLAMARATCAVCIVVLRFSTEVFQFSFRVQLWRGFLRTFSSCLVASVCTWSAHLLNKCWSEKILLSHFRVMWGSANISALSCRMSHCLSPTLMWSGCVAAGLLCKLPFGFKYMLQIAKLSFCSWFLLYSQTTWRSTKVQCMLWSSWKQVVEYTGRSQK